MNTAKLYDPQQIVPVSFLLGINIVFFSRYAPLGMILLH